MSSSHRDAESRDPKMIGPWRIGKTIGKGSSGPSASLSCGRCRCGGGRTWSFSGFDVLTDWQSMVAAFPAFIGRVKIGKHTQTGQLAAVKIVPKQALLNSRMSLSEADKKVSPSKV